MIPLKWLKKLRLANWHYFPDETLHFGRQTIVTGRNTAGKSTIIDALQALFVANQKQIRFNAAAHEDAKRSLISYLRGKVGSQVKAFLRDESFTSYIIAEFLDEHRRESFLVGVAIDVYADDSIVEEYFLGSGCTLDDLHLVAPSGALYNREQFKAQHLALKFRYERNKSSWQKTLLARLGSLDERFFGLFTKAISFRPLEDVRDFVNSYILEERILRLDVMRDSFEMHEKYQLELRILEERRKLLADIAERFQQYTNYRDLATRQEYVVLRLQALLQEQRATKLSVEIMQLRQHDEQMQASLQLLEYQQQDAEQQANEAYKRWQSDELQQRQLQLKRKLQEVEAQYQGHSDQLHAFYKAASADAVMLEELSLRENEAWWQWEVGEQEQVLQLTELLHSLSSAESTMDDGVMQQAEGVLLKGGSLLAKLCTRLIKTIGQLENHLTELSERAEQLRQEISALHKKQRTYSQSVHQLKRLLEHQLGERSPVWIFCEEVELLDENWRNALEGWLNTQRFDLLVQPDVFTEALSLYERAKHQHNLDGVGLVDTEKERRYLGQREPGSLGDLISTRNEIIQARVDHLLGKVMCAADEQELRRHRTAVTRSCMAYSNLVARQIPRDRFAIPYLGSGAIKRQLEIKQHELADLEQEVDELQTELTDLKGLTEGMGEPQGRYKGFAGQLSIPAQLELLAEERRQIGGELANIDDSQIQALKDAYERCKQRQQELREQIADLNRKQATGEEKLRMKVQDQELGDRQLEQATKTWQAWLEVVDRTMADRAEARWHDALRGDQPIEQKISNWDSNRKRNEKLSSNARDELVGLRVKYNLAYALSTDTKAEDNEAYQRLLDKVAGVDIPEYQVRLESAREKSEDEFKSHFIYRMREAIGEARRELDRMNAALSQFPFHGDRYRFEVRKSEKYGRFYDAIMDRNIGQRDSLFALIQDEHSAVLRELFDQLIRGDLGDQSEFTDYRRYLDFDIIVTDSNGAPTSFSKVLREKSGGETQTPFYIVMLAAFNQLYGSDRAMRLVVFDEAFNKMDEARIQTSLRLIKQLNLQLVAAVPDEKMQHMAREVQTVLIVTRQDHRCFVDRLGMDDEEGSADELASIPKQIAMLPD